MSTETKFLGTEKLEDLFSEYVEAALDALNVTIHETSTDTSEADDVEHIRDFPVAPDINHHDGERAGKDIRRLYDTREATAGEVPRESEYVTTRVRYGSLSGRRRQLVIGWNTLPTTREIRLAETLIDAEYDPSGVQHSAGVGEEILAAIFGRNPHEHDLWVSSDELAAAIIDQSRSGLSTTQIEIDGEVESSYEGDSYRNVHDTHEVDDADRPALSSIWTASTGHVWVTVERWNTGYCESESKVFIRSLQMDEPHKIDLDRGESNLHLSGTFEYGGEELDVSVEIICVPELPDPRNMWEFPANHSLRPITSDAADELTGGSEG
ncbi:hypothetical protein [Salinigranum marinum]|uniref:hypothetical protein n=1 Tax=Salinigranum marinum TaxID=1515595 RepID=UPI002989D34C|nr:hypothetical protein [Salinigranum marinum]